ncbi:MAG TPA: glycoside hydrolase family 15 protein [Nocardioidaceae bacterium]|nr:glycoside hydrolase family 15 protein [Nocardioidaceae bacterium]
MCAAVNPSAPIRSAGPDRRDRLRARSVQLLREAQHPDGAWPAAPGFAPYRYSWFRDGSFIAEGASAAGLRDEATRFHHWCASVLRRERAAVDRVVAALADGRAVPDTDYLPARYNLDGTRHVDDWWNFQVDGYGTWLWALERHLARAGHPAEQFGDAIEVAVRYLLATGRDTCRDWWEEHRDQVHVTTLAGVAAGLRSAVRLGTLAPDLAEAASAFADAAVGDIRRHGIRDGHLVKWLGGRDVDASLVAVAALYDVFPVDDPLVTETVRQIERRLVDGGVHRYEADTFYGGGQWPVLACLLAWHHVRAGDPQRAAQLVDWVVSVADDDLLLPEQTGPRRAPQVLDEWLERWGPSAHPLVWSHGMFLAVPVGP